MVQSSLIPRPPCPMAKGGLAKCCKILGPNMSHIILECQNTNQISSRPIMCIHIM